MSSRDFYAILGVSRDASEECIRQAFRRCALLHHPDKNPDNEVSEQKFKDVIDAYHTLCNKLKRNLFDRFGECAALDLSESTQAVLSTFWPSENNTHSPKQKDADSVAVAAIAEQNQPRQLVQPTSPITPPSRILVPPAVSFKHQLSDISPEENTRPAKRQRTNLTSYGLPVGTRVRITNSHKNPELNGAAGTVQGFDESSQCFVVNVQPAPSRSTKVVAAETSAAPTPTPTPTPTSSTVQVRLQDLQQASTPIVIVGTVDDSLNHTVATAIGFSDRVQAYAVQTSAGQTLALRPENVMLVPGTSVRVNDPTISSCFHNRWGRVKAWDSAAQKFAVAFDASHTTLAVAPNSLRL